MGSSSVGHAFVLAFDYFRLVTMVLERFISKAEAGTGARRIAEELQIDHAVVDDICKCLTSAGILARSAGSNGQRLALDPSDITLNDVWRAVGGIHSVRKTESIDPDQTFASKVDLIISQAFIEIDFSIGTHLRRFRLDCIQASRRQWFPAGSRPNYEPETDAITIAGM